MRKILTALLLCAALCATADPSPKFEMRGAWLATIFGIDWPGKAGVSADVAADQQKQLEDIVDGLHRAGINAVFFQVRPNADALYPSKLQPWSQHLTGRRGLAANYDPLALCIDLCHDRGMECHAWINPYRVGKEVSPTPADSPHSDLWMTNTVGNTTMTIYNPGLERTRQLVCDVVAEIASGYDIDGVVFDDYFYNPEFIPNDSTAADWNTYIDAGTDLSIDQWRRRNVDTTIDMVYRRLLSIKDGKLRFGMAPQGIAGGNGVHADRGVPSPVDYGVITRDSQYDKIFCDPVAWLLNRSVDYVSPQIYWQTDNPRHPFGGLVRWWNDVAEACSRHCFTSVTLARFDNEPADTRWDETLLQIATNRDAVFNGAPGCVFYSVTYLSGAKRSDLADRLSQTHFAAPALVPPMTWRTQAVPLAVESLRLSGNTLSWQPAGDCRYVVYAIPREIPLDEALSTDSEGFAPQYIHCISYKPSVTLDAKVVDSSHIAVAPYDRYGNEWTPTILNR